jgi:hypothetical protein
MKTLFLKELYHGRFLLLFSLALGLLIPFGYQALGKTNTYANLLVPGQSDLVGICGVMALLLPIALALFAGAGLFASEVDRGTLPLLLELPFSRGRIWLVKMLAGLALVALGTAALIGITRLLLPEIAQSISVIAYLPDLCLALLFAFSIAIFTSTISRHALAAVVGALLLGGGLAMGMFILYTGVGAPLLGYDSLLDLCLWLGLVAPALLISSVVVLRSGELLHSWRKYPLAFAILLVILFSTILSIIGLSRWSTRYRRGAMIVMNAWPSHNEGSSSILTFLALANPVPFQRAGATGGWKLRSADTDSQGHRYQTGSLYRSNHGVVIDLHSGKELYIARSAAGEDSNVLACSHNGRYAIVSDDPAGLTWDIGSDRFYKHYRQKLQIMDLRTQRVVRNIRLDQCPADMQWSARDNYLAFWLQDNTDNKARWALYVMPLTGAMRKLHTTRRGPMENWAWSPTEEVVYHCDDTGRLWRIPVDGREKRVIWSAERKSLGMDGSCNVRRLLSSANGRWLALAFNHVETQQTEKAIFSRATKLQTYVISADGSASYCAFANMGHFPKLAWSAQGNTLFLLDLDNLRQNRLYRWNLHDKQAQRIGQDLAMYASLYPYPHARGVLLYPYPEETAQTFATDIQAPSLIGEDGSIRPLLPAEFARYNHFVTFDDQDRLITIRNGKVDRLVATDMQTGKSTVVYP